VSLGEPIHSPSQCDDDNDAVVYCDVTWFNDREVHDNIFLQSRHTRTIVFGHLSITESLETQSCRVYGIAC